MSNIRYFEEYRRQILDILDQESVPSDIRNFEKWRFKVLTGLKDQATAEALGSSIRSGDVYREEVLKALDVSDYTRDDIINEKKWRAKVLDAMGQEYTTADINYFERWREKVTVGLDDFAGGVWKTVSGSIASFDDAKEAPMKSLVAEINPIQDLHGQDAPYPAGGSANIWDEEWEVGYIVPSTGANNDSYTDRIRSKNFIPISPNTTYYKKTPTAFWNIYFDENKNYLGYADAVIDRTFTTPADAHYMKFATESNYGGTYRHDISINYPSTVTGYHPYSNICPISGWSGVKVYHSGADQTNPTVYSIPFKDSNGDPITVYGGEIDVVSGLLKSYPFYSSYNGETLSGEWICDRAVYSQGTTPPIGSQVVDMSGNGTEYQLEPTEIKSLKGSNNVWADTGDVEVTYKAKKGGGE